MRLLPKSRLPPADEPPAEEADEHSDSNVQECIPNNHSTREVRSESVPHRSCSYRSQRELHYQLASGGHAIILSFSSPTDQESESGCLSLLAATHQPDGRAVARELPLMLVGFLLVCATVLAKYSGKTACEPNPSAGCAAELTKAGCKTCVGADAAQTCTECTTSGYKVQLDKRSCGPTCPAHSTASSNVCECDQGYTLNAGKTACVAASNTQCNTPNCKACDNPKTDSEICTECNDGNYLTPTKQCTQSCGTIGNYYNGNKACEPCDPSCAACTTTGPAKCTLCPPGKRLQYTDEGATQNGGSCVDECKPQSGASGCETCGATIGGTKYCSKCSTSTEVPVNGVCTADNARAAACKVKDGKGGCTTCASGYFRQDNGCYKTDRQPGIQICTLADSNGGCQTCANGLQPNNGACPSCHSTCKTCSTADTANACTTCAAGYYMIGSGPNTCISCDSNSGSVKGVAGCMSCAPPPSGTGSVLCYLMNGDSAGGSTNKSGLSTGAIAGISVAVIVVVGGLIGFLCWWFLCRGKA